MEIIHLPREEKDTSQNLAEILRDLANTPYNSAATFYKWYQGLGVLPDYARYGEDCVGKLRLLELGLKEKGLGEMRIVRNINPLSPGSTETTHYAAIVEGKYYLDPFLFQTDPIDFSTIEPGTAVPAECVVPSRRLLLSRTTDDPNRLQVEFQALSTSCSTTPRALLYYEYDIEGSCLEFPSPVEYVRFNVPLDCHAVLDGLPDICRFRLDMRRKRLKVLGSFGRYISDEKLVARFQSKYGITKDELIDYFREATRVALYAQYWIKEGALRLK